MKLYDRELIAMLQQAYSAEKAAAFAYQGHAASIKNVLDKQAIRQIEEDEWHHRRSVRKIMLIYEIPVSRFYECKYHVIGKLISWSCFVIGRFMPFYFAGRLESGNVCEYFKMKQHFNALGISDHDALLYEMGIKEKEHEDYFASKVKDDPMLPCFEYLFSWSAKNSLNNVDLKRKLPVSESESYCKNS